MGNVDRIIRLIIAVVIAILFFTDTIDGVTAIVLMILAGIFLVTSIVGICPLYMLFRISTFKNRI